MGANTAPRWGRLVADLAAVGITATVTERPYPGGVSRCIILRGGPGMMVEVHDKWWRKNDDVWIGWQVHAEDADAIVTATRPVSKKRSETVAAVVALLTP